jgi:protoporphyrin/coproporphyrin ferrochelatase
MLGVLLLNFGGPETLDDVQPYLYNLFNDPYIIQLPRPLRFLQGTIAKTISARRAPQSRGYYAKIGGGSPLRRSTEDQARALGARLAERGARASVYVGMRYWDPYIREAAERIVRDGVTELVVLPLYPQYSVTTTGTSLEEARRALKNAGLPASARVHEVCAYHDHPGYVGALASRIREALGAFPDPDGVHLLFSAHSIPEKIVDRGDPYRDHTETSVRLVLERLGAPNDHTLAYQSKIGPVKWLGPATDETIRELGRRGVRQVLAVPISFVGEHSETLYEIDILYKGLAAECGIEHFGKAPALDTEPQFVDALADLVLRQVGGSYEEDGRVPGRREVKGPTI